LNNNERVLYAKLVDTLVETLNVRQGFTFKALRRNREQTITRRNERVFNGDNDDNNNELLAALRTEFERRQQTNQAQQEAVTRRRANQYTIANTDSTVNAAKGTDVNNNNDNNDNNEYGEDDANVSVNNNNNNASGTISESDAGTDDDGKVFNKEILIFFKITT
jgi:hypothetical protein